MDPPPISGPLGSGSQGGGEVVYLIKSVPCPSQEEGNAESIEMFEVDCNHDGTEDTKAAMGKQSS